MEITSKLLEMILQKCSTCLWNIHYFISYVMTNSYKRWPSHGREESNGNKNKNSKRWCCFCDINISMLYFSSYKDHHLVQQKKQEEISH